MRLDKPRKRQFRPRTEKLVDRQASIKDIKNSFEEPAKAWRRYLRDGSSGSFSIEDLSSVAADMEKGNEIGKYCAAMARAEIALRSEKRSDQYIKNIHEATQLAEHAMRIQDDPLQSFIYCSRYMAMPLIKLAHAHDIISDETLEAQFLDPTKEAYDALIDMLYTYLCSMQYDDQSKHDYRGLLTELIIFRGLLSVPYLIRSDILPLLSFPYEDRSIDKTSVFLKRDGMRDTSIVDHSILNNNYDISIRDLHCPKHVIHKLQVKMNKCYSLYNDDITVINASEINKYISIMLDIKEGRHNIIYFFAAEHNLDLRNKKYQALGNYFIDHVLNIS